MAVDYILMKKSEKPEETDKVKLISIYEDDQYCIYQVESVEER